MCSTFEELLEREVKELVKGEGLSLKVGLGGEAGNLEGLGKLVGNTTLFYSF